MNKIASRLRARARNKDKNQLTLAGMVQFGIWDDELHGHNATSAPDTPRFKSDIGTLVDIIDTACGEDFIVTLTKTKEVFFKGQDILHETDATTDWVKIPVPGGGATKIAAGSHHVMIINSVGHILSFGIGAQGQLGHGNHKNVSQPSVIQYFISNDITALDVACTDASTVVIGNDGLVYAWGLLDFATSTGGTEKRKFFVHSNTPKPLQWGNKIDVSKGPKLRVHGGRFVLYYPLRTSTHAPGTPSTPSSIAAKLSKKKGASSGKDTSGSSNTYVMNQLKEFWRIVTHLKKPFPNVRVPLAEITYDEQELMRIKMERAKIKEALQKTFDRVISLDHDKDDPNQELLKSMIIESIETHLELEDLRIAQIDDARKGRLIGRFRRKLSRSHLGDLMPDANWSLKNLSEFRELAFESTQLLQQLAEQAHIMAAKFSEEGHLSLPMQSANLLVELSSLRAFVNEQIFFTLRGILQEGEAGHAANSIVDRGSVHLRFTCQKLIHLWSLYEKPNTLENIDRVKSIFGELMLLKVSSAGGNTSDFDPEDLPLASRLVDICLQCFTAYRLKYEHESHHETVL